MATANKREAFCLTYFSLPDERGRGRRAAVAVGYSEKTASVTASKLLADPDIQARLKELAFAKLNGTPPPMPGGRPMPVSPGSHPSQTGQWPFSPPGADHGTLPADPPAGSDPFDGQTTEDPLVFLERTMNNPKVDVKIRTDAAKALLPFKHAKLGEVGKKDQQKQKAGDLAGGKSRFAGGRAPGQLRAV